MNDRWTAIRRCAREVLARYERKTQFNDALPKAFTPERGCHAILREIVRHAFPDEFFLKLNCRTLPDNVDGRLDYGSRAIQVRADVEGVRKPFIAAHEVGHLELKHPLRHLCRDAKGSASDADQNQEPSAHDDGAATLDDQAHPGALNCRDGVAAAYRERDRLELEANIFAAELLAPLDRVRARIAADSTWTVESLASYFGLSKDAMRNQLVAAFIACPRPDVLGDNQDKAEPIDESTPRVELPDYLKLDDSQRQAAHAKTPALTVAGPGAGKTRVLTARHVHLVRDEGIEPRRILALTFSNKAAAEMQERLIAALPDQAHEIQVFTFHSFGRLLLQSYGHTLGMEDDPTVLTDADGFVLARSHLHELPLGQFANLNEPTQHLEAVLARVARLKEEQISPKEFERRVRRWQNELEAQLEPASSAERIRWHESRDIAAKCGDLAAFYAAYEELLHRAGYVDYADLINRAVDLFDHPEVAALIRADYERILVDEFQDVDASCGRLVQAVDGGRGILWAVADPRQNIYGFRGASLAHLVRFESDYPGAQIKFLEVNYRSVEEVVVAGNAIRFPPVTGGQAFQVPPLRADRGEGGAAAAVRVSLAGSRGEEIAELVAQVREVAQEVPREQIAVLCRDKWWAKDICAALEEADIATNWSGQPEEQDAFKDMMAVLLLATNQPQALLRLGRIAEHQLEEHEIQIILRKAGEENNRLHVGLLAAKNGELEGISAIGQLAAKQLGRLWSEFRRLPNAWCVLAAYLFERTRWLRAKLDDPSPRARRYLATVCQVIDLAREFSLKGSFAQAKDTPAFLDYIASAREFSRLPCADSTPVIADAVNVLTIHKSKGLEWPVVFVPGWTTSSNSRADDVPLPAHLVHQDGSALAGDEAYNQACLYYVATTRARNQLLLSRSDSINSDPVPHLDEIAESLQPRGLLRCDNVRRTPWRRPLAVASGRVRLTENLIPYAMIRQYEYCSQRAKYDYVYGLRAESGGYLFFSRQLQHALEWIADESANGQVPSGDEIQDKIEELWARDKKPHRRLSPLYRGQALHCAQSFAARLVPGVKIDLKQEWHVPLPDANPHAEPVSIVVKVDEIEWGEPIIARLHRLDEQHLKHEADPILSLYALLPLNDGNSEGIEFRMNYLKNGEEKVLNLRDDPHIEKRRKQIFAAAHAIRNGLFEPKPSNWKMCHRCSYNLICPA